MNSSATLHNACIGPLGPQTFSSIFTLISRLFLVFLIITRASKATIQSTENQDTIPSTAAQDQFETLSQLEFNESPVSLHQNFQCPTSPKPDCSVPHCQGPLNICQMQFQCEASTPFYSNGKYAVMTGCRCCPPLIHVWCPNYDCRAPPGTRQCASEQLEGCACETNENHMERYERNIADPAYQLIDTGDFEDIIEVNDDGLLDNESTTLTQPGARRPGPSRNPHHLVQESATQQTGAMPLPTSGLDQQLLHLVRDAQVGLLVSS